MLAKVVDDICGVAHELGEVFRRPASEKRVEKLIKRANKGPSPFVSLLFRFLTSTIKYIIMRNYKASWKF